MVSDWFWDKVTNISRVFLSTKVKASYGVERARAHSLRGLAGRTGEGACRLLSYSRYRLRIRLPLPLGPRQTPRPLRPRVAFAGLAWPCFESRPQLRHGSAPRQLRGKDMRPLPPRPCGPLRERARGGCFSCGRGNKSDGFSFSPRVPSGARPAPPGTRFPLGPPIVPPALRPRARVRAGLPPYRPNPPAGARFAALVLGRAGSLLAAAGQVPVITPTGDWFDAEGDHRAGGGSPGRACGGGPRVGGATASRWCNAVIIEYGFADAL